MRKKYFPFLFFFFIFKVYCWAILIFSMEMVLGHFCLDCAFDKNVGPDFTWVLLPACYSMIIWKTIFFPWLEQGPLAGNQRFLPLWECEATIIHMSLRINISKFLLQGIFVLLLILFPLWFFFSAGSWHLLASMREFYSFPLISLRHG